MPADRAATAYEWYMAMYEESRIVKFRWEPDNSTILSSMTMGTMTFQTRGRPEDEWEVLEGNNGVLMEWHLPWVVAQTMARNQGFSIEVAIS